MNMVSKILEDAAKLVERGWTQRIFAIDRQGSYVRAYAYGYDIAEISAFCARGAVQFAIKNQGKYIEPKIVRKVYAAVLYQIGFHTSASRKNLEGWNDGSERKQEEVVSMFRKAAVRAQTENYNA